MIIILFSFGESHMYYMSTQLLLFFFLIRIIDLVSFTSVNVQLENRAKMQIANSMMESLKER